MATTAATPTTEPGGDQCVVMHGVGWESYTAMLRVRGERSRPRMTYLDGDVVLMSPSYPHEHLEKRLGHFVMEVVTGLDIPCVPTGSTTFRRRMKRGGVEPGESFYLANAPRVHGKTRLSLRVDPPPDLAIEAVDTHDADEAVEVYRRFGVPEVWVCDGDALRILALQPDGRYAPSAASTVFPFLTAAEVFDWIARPQTGNETEWVKDLRRWVRDVLAPRARNAAGGA